MIIARLSSFKEQQNQPEGVKFLRFRVKQIDPKSGIVGRVVDVVVYLMWGFDLKRKTDDVFRRK
ncbi:MAG TPA: hypothetical protein DEQ32_16785 [Gammaproteobacteria bacterium]|nr:hypothetical protein [Gammaproteobacteria bacterium]